ncbi:aminotransferase class III-fold pyridoxal phosphate-dependent enzyme [Streptomyces sp. NBC_00210]|uniref:aspartate aminotransferase family protein n=1 Tax=Streptomyces sp. NBC_00210 TaxID=2903636 RepID=UPI003250CD20
MNAITPRLCGNDALLAAARAVIAGGGSSNMRNLGIQDPLVVDRAMGARLWDVEGNELIDVNMGYGPHLFGYADAEVVGAVSERLRLGAMTGIIHRLDPQAGELISALMPSVEQVRFANSGTEAITSAIRLARFHTDRTLVVTFEGHYHGWSDTLLRGAITAGSTGQHGRTELHAAPGTNPEALWHTVQLPWNDTDALTRFFADRGAEVAAVICEPICANAGVVHPLPGFLAQLAQLAADNGALVVFDEVITGFRVSRGGAQELLGIRPDISIISKVLGGGFPVAAFGASREIMNPLARNEAFHGGVYSGNHAAVQAVVSMLGKIQRSPSVYTDLEESCSHLEKKLRDSFAEAGRHVRIARAGSVMSVAVLSGPQTGLEAYDAAMDAIDFAAHRRFQGHCQRGGLYFHPNPLEPWFLSSAHSREDMDRIVDVVALGLRALAE